MYLFSLPPRQSVRGRGRYCQQSFIARGSEFGEAKAPHVLQVRHEKAMTGCGGATLEL